MAIINEQRRAVPPLPDPRDTDQARINRQIIEVIKFLLTRIQQGGIEMRVDALEKKVQNHDDVING